jgi:hypothetical protein
VIVVRNIFQLKFGKMQEARDLWKEVGTMMRKHGLPESRLLTDLTGTFYTLVAESTHKDLAEYQENTQKELGLAEFRSWYQRFIPLVESVRRELFAIVD